MEKPTCLCGQEMTFLADNKRREIFQCENCGRLQLQAKDGTCKEVYVPRAGLKEGWDGLKLALRR